MYIVRLPYFSPLQGLKANFNLIKQLLNLQTSAYRIMSEIFTRTYFSQLLLVFCGDNSRYIIDRYLKGNAKIS